MNIIFTDILGYNLYPPTPAIKSIPDWYIKMNEYVTEKKEIKTKVLNEEISPFNPATIKKCMPVFDAMTTGYILYMPFDLFVKQQDGEPYYMWRTGKIEFHPKTQFHLYPKLNEYEASPKFVNNWIIETPKGYSCLVVAPMHRPDTEINILPGIVDTDNYTSPIGFPFVLKNKQFEGLIPAGTPMAQIIPFKREKWKMKFGNEKNSQKSDKVIYQLQTKWFNSYKTHFWNKKEYK
jgi:hypothetical protein